MAASKWAASFGGYLEVKRDGRTEHHKQVHGVPVGVASPALGGIGAVGCSHLVAGSADRSGTGTGKKRRLRQNLQRAHNDHERRASLEEGIAGLERGIEEIQG